jgi:hypothetical protein
VTNVPSPIPTNEPDRVLCTGSRTFTDELVIAAELSSLRYWQMREREIVIVHGACPDGADAIVDRVARKLGYTVERHPADTSRHGSPLAFYIRNQHMVDLGARLCLAFWVPGKCSTSSNAMRKAEGAGTGDTFTRAVAAGIPARLIPQATR